MRSLHRIDDIKRVLESGGVAITPNRQWARELQSLLLPGNAGKMPEVYSVTGWVERTWSDLALDAAAPFATHAPMDLTCETALWRTVLMQDGSLHEQARGSLAVQCQDAWDKCVLYRQSLDEAGGDSLQALVRFRGWTETFRKMADERSLVARAEALEWLVDRLPPDRRLNLKAVVLYGFAPTQADELGPEPTPLLQEFIAANSKACYMHSAAESPMPEAVRCIYSGTADELVGAAQWARDNPECSVQIIVPELARVREQMECTLLEHLDESEWKISLGALLADTEALQMLRLWLAFAHEQLPTERLLNMLRSRVLCSQSHAVETVAWLERRLRSRSNWQYSPHTLQRTLAGLVSDAQPDPERVQLLKHWMRGVFALKRLPQAQSFASWARSLYRLWHRLGALQRLQADVLGKLEELLEQLQGLGTLDSREDVQLHEVLDWLDWLAQRLRLDIPRGPRRVMVGASLDSVSGEVDCTWIVGFDAHNWPRGRRTNPLLPNAWQTEKAMPGASDLASLDFARHLFSRLAMRSRRLVLSISPNETGQLEESSLMELLDECQDTNAELPTAEGVAMQAVDDSAPVPWSDSEVLQERYVRTLQLIESDSFAAFVTARLGGVQPMSPAQPGSALALGRHLHRLMEKLLPEGAVAMPDPLPQEVVDEIWQEQSRQLPQPQQDTVRTVLQRALQDWCEYETGLRWAYRVQATESLLQGRDGMGFPYRVKLDRVDAMGDGEVILDYKTGKAVTAGMVPLGTNGIQLALYGLLYQREHGRCPLGLLYAYMDLGAASAPALAGVLDESLQGSIAFPSRSRKVQFVSMPEYMQNLEQIHRHWLNRLKSGQVDTFRAANAFGADTLLLLRPQGAIA